MDPRRELVRNWEEDAAEWRAAEASHSRDAAMRLQCANELAATLDKYSGDATVLTLVDLIRGLEHERRVLEESVRRAEQIVAAVMLQGVPPAIRADFPVGERLSSPFLRTPLVQRTWEEYGKLWVDMNVQGNQG